MSRLALILSFLLLAFARAVAGETSVSSSAWVDLGAPPMTVAPRGGNVYVFQGASPPADTSTSTLLGSQPGASHASKAYSGALHLFAKAAPGSAWPVPVVLTPPTQSVSVSGAVAFDHSAPGSSDNVVAGPTRVVCVTPTITASTYAANQPIGGVLTFSGIFDVLAAHGLARIAPVNPFGPTP